MNIKYNLSLLSLYNLSFIYTNISELKQNYNYIKDLLDLKLIDFNSSLDLLLEKNFLIIKNNRIYIKQMYKRTLCRYKATLNFCMKENKCDYIHYIYELKFICCFTNHKIKDINFVNFNKYLLDLFDETIYEKCKKKDDRYQLFINNRLFYCKFTSNNNKKEIVNPLENKKRKGYHYNIKKDYSSEEFSDENDKSNYKSNYKSSYKSSYNRKSKNLHKEKGSYNKRKREKSSFDRYESNNKYIEDNFTKRKKIKIQILENDRKLKEEEEKLRKILLKKKKFES